MKTSNTIWLFILIFILVISFFLFLNKSASQDEAVSTLRSLASCVDCYSDKITDSIWDLPHDTVLINGFISLKTWPLSTELEQKLMDWGVTLDKDSVVFENVWTSIPVGHLYDIAGLEQVTSIFTLEK